MSNANPKILKVSKNFAAKKTISKIVTKNNIHKLNIMKKNISYPKIVIIIPRGRYEDGKLRKGDIIKRHLINGDVILHNSIWKKIKIVKKKNLEISLIKSDFCLDEMEKLIYQNKWKNK